eukprot:Awhi_evm1s7516
MLSSLTKIPSFAKSSKTAVSPTQDDDKKKKKKTATLVCAHCQEKMTFFKKSYRTTCGHKFHFKCLKAISDKLIEENSAEGKDAVLTCPCCWINLEKDHFFIRNDGKLGMQVDWQEYSTICAEVERADTTSVSNAPTADNQVVLI